MAAMESIHLPGGSHYGMWKWRIRKRVFMQQGGICTTCQLPMTLGAPGTDKPGNATFLGGIKKRELIHQKCQGFGDNK